MRMRFITLKTCDGHEKGRLAFYCRMLEVSRQGFYDYLVAKDQPWKYQEIADRMKAKFPSIKPKSWMRYIEDHATVVSAVPLATQVCEDADDDVFLACAVAANAKIVCSGDKHMLACNGWNGIEVLTPRLFNRRLRDS